MKAWRQRVHDRFHPEVKVKEEDLARELNVTIRCAIYSSPEHRKENVARLAGRFGSAARDLLLGRRP